MVNIELVIKIPEDYYNGIKTIPDRQCDADMLIIKYGTPLPKGYSELVDKQIIADYVHSHIQEINTGYGDLNQHTNRILRMIENYIDNAPTIIESDKAESEDKE